MIFAEVSPMHRKARALAPGRALQVPRHASVKP
jgi:hypothetical protein